MRKLFPLLICALGLAFSAPAGAATLPVTITKAGFAPSDLTVKAGDAIRWTNADTAVHQVAFDRVNCQLLLQPGQQGSCSFGTPGSYSYRDPSQKGSFRGRVTVTQAPAAVTLQASRQIVVHGGLVTLSGSVSNRQAGERVMLLVQRFREPAATQLVTVQTTAEGSWRYVVKPTIQTTYQVRWKNASSTSVMVKVRPRVTLFLRGGLFRTKVTAARSYAGRYIYLQRRAVGRWINVRRVRLNALSAARFRARLPQGLSRVRIFMPQRQAGAGYLAGFSRRLLVRR